MIGGMSREEILRRFEVWLDGALTAEEPPRGIDAEILAAMTGGDREGGARPAPTAAYSLWAAMTALTQEVKLQGRSFKELNDMLGAQASRMAERERDLPREAERRCRKEVLGFWSICATVWGAAWNRTDVRGFLHDSALMRPHRDHRARVACRAATRKVRSV
jgi:hypothetical protein